MRVDRLLWTVGSFLRAFLEGERTAFEFYRYRRDWVVARVTEAGPDRGRWPVAAAWVVAPGAGKGFLGWRVREIERLPANIRFLGIHERLMRQLSPGEKQELSMALKGIGAGLFTYIPNSVRKVIQPQFIAGAYAGYWPAILEEIETYRFLERY